MSIEEQTAAESLDPVADGEPADIATTLSLDAIKKVNAGAQLVYALYHRDAEWWKDQPLGLTRAYVRASKAYGVGAGPSW